MSDQKHWHRGLNSAGEVHVWPCGDAQQHDGRADVTCDCMPNIGLEKDEEGADLWVYTHQAWDGRPFVDPDEVEDESSPGKRHFIVFDPFGLSVAAGVALSLGALGGWLVGRRR